MKLTRYDKPMKDDSSGLKRGRPVNEKSYNSLGKKYGINYGTLRNRMQKGMTLEEAVSKPILNRRECGIEAAKARWGGTK